MNAPLTIRRLWAWTGLWVAVPLWAGNMLLGLHTTHILTDLVDTLVLAALMFTRHGDNPRRFGDVQDNAMYWNFVVGTWLPLYGCIYWLARL